MTLVRLFSLWMTIRNSYPVGDKEYIALLPMNDDSDEVLIYRFIDNGEDQDPELENIEDDDEYDAAVDAFDEILDEDEFDEF